MRDKASLGLTFAGDLESNHGPLTFVLDLAITPMMLTGREIANPLANSLPELQHGIGRETTSLGKPLQMFGKGSEAIDQRVIPLITIPTTMERAKTMGHVIPLSCLAMVGWS